MQFAPAGTSALRTTRARARARRALMAMEGTIAINAFGGAWYAVAGAPDVP